MPFLRVHDDMWARLCSFFFASFFSTFDTFEFVPPTHLTETHTMPPQELPKYLRPDFDPWSIKMDLIRDILIQHGIKPPTGAVRKQELVDMFNLHIKPQVAKLREAHENIVPSEEGIIKVPKGKGTILELYDGDNDDSDSIPPRSAKATRPKSVGQPVVEVDCWSDHTFFIFKIQSCRRTALTNILVSYFRSSRFLLR